MVGTDIPDPAGLPRGFCPCIATKHGAYQRALRGLDMCPSRTCLAGDDDISQLRTVGDSEMTADAYPLLGEGTTAASAKNQPSDSPRVSKRHWRYRKSESEIA